MTTSEDGCPFSANIILNDTIFHCGCGYEFDRDVRLANAVSSMWHRVYILGMDFWEIKGWTRLKTHGFVLSKD